MVSDTASGSAIPLYNRFVIKAQSLNPRFLVMIIPSRWFSGGRGLDDFRVKMLNDHHIKELVDFPDSRDCFPGVDIAGGVCYFLWDSQYSGKCKTSNFQGQSISSAERYLDEFPVFIRYVCAVDIIRKVQSKNERIMSDYVYSSKPFGLRSFEEGEKKKFNGAIGLFGSRGITFVHNGDVKNNQSLVGRWKVIISKTSAEHAGQADKDGKKKIISRVIVLPPNSICSESYLLLDTFEVEEYANNLMQYAKTMFFRFMLSTVLLTQNIAKDKFQFVPMQDFSHPWTDEMLYRKYGLTDEEIAFIESMIRPMEG